MATSVAMNAADSPAAEARKRRREILSSQRDAAAASVATTCPESPTSVMMDSTSASNKKLKMEVAPAVPVLSSGTVAVAPDAMKTVISSKTGKPKKPQMKYDPDVPMTKEEAAVWRREQRRKRNRESAAASRQRQRDRIAELEVEVEEWKTKFDEVMKRISQLEDAAAANGDKPVSAPIVPDAVSPKEVTVEAEAETATMETQVQESTTSTISPNLVPSHPPCVSPPGSPVGFGSQEVEVAKVISGNVTAQVPMKDAVVEESQPTKMISRPA